MRPYRIKIRESIHYFLLSPFGPWARKRWRRVFFLIWYSLQSISIDYPINVERTLFQLLDSSVLFVSNKHFEPVFPAHLSPPGGKLCNPGDCVPKLSILSSAIIESFRWKAVLLRKLVPIHRNARKPHLSRACVCVRHVCNELFLVLSFFVFFFFIVIENSHSRRQKMCKSLVGLGKVPLYHQLKWLHPHISHQLFLFSPNFFLYLFCWLISMKWAQD